VGLTNELARDRHLQLTGRGDDGIMGHHLTADGKFKSDKFPDLPEGFVAIKIMPKTARGLQFISDVYWSTDREFAEDLEQAILNMKRANHD